MQKELIYIFILFLLTSCGTKVHSEDKKLDQHKEVEQSTEAYQKNKNGQFIHTRFPPPSGYQRTDVDSSSFGQYLRNLKLKTDGATVKYYDGAEKGNFGVYEAVVDLEIGRKDLHQCADAVMRLRADYLWNAERYRDIHFNFTNGFRVDYSEWIIGKRMVIEGNRTYWKQSANSSNSYGSYWKYLELIFTYAGTLSLSKELLAVNLEDIKIGDVFIQGGSPGHAVIVVDICEHPKSKEKMFMLAQSYMPAQEIQILSNPNSEPGNPWYSLNFQGDLKTPEWTFEKTDLKRFENR